jgi:hypothetical protein
MQNVVHNGFGCPFCRTQMAERIEEKQEDEDDDDDSYFHSVEERYIIPDNTFVTMRRMFQRAENTQEDAEEEDAEEDAEEEEEQDQDQDQDEDDEEETERKPTASMVMRKLIGQGVSYEDFVKYSLLEHDEYSFNDEFETTAEKIFGVIRIVVSNYNPQETTPEPEPRFSNIFTMSPMPDFNSFNVEELKTICQDYGIRYRNTTRTPSVLENVWRRHHITTSNE